MWKEQKEFDCIVVGGGPAGSTFARVAAEGGLSVLLLEKDRDIGVPVRCGEAISDAGLRIFHEPNPRWIASTINRIKLVAPNETVVEFDLHQKGYILDRRIFDYDLAEFASIAGAQIVTKAYIDGLIIEDDKVVGVKGTHVGERFEKRAKIVVGADGVESRVGRWAGLKTTVKLKDMECGIQKTVTGIDVNEHMFDFYLSKKWAPGGYLWVFPKGKHKANIGLAISGYYAKDGKAAHKFLDEFLAWKYPNASVLTTVVGGVPVAKTVKQMVMDGLMLVGDAARTVNPVTGGGIISGMRSGLLAAETAVKALRNGGPIRKNLSSYEKEWHKIGGKNHERFYRIKETIFRFTDDDLNRIADGIANVPEDGRSLLKLFTIAVSKKPSLLIDVTRVFTGI
ncbi:MAG: NAD(P)/FAD-dependent oxidoreductase [Candidatus Marinimicrobia bacterium]|nr:NAD(P)/FAD-dependent oxidoreductase [Candidatus Neomarinimicrobiota bacterium]|tara:strand:+ start:680 stop:1867 length:1188 start_codon:yes stop_codon:yes gene_type:complete